MNGNFRPTTRIFGRLASLCLAAAILSLFAVPHVLAQGSSSVTKTVPSNREPAPAAPAEAEEAAAAAETQASEPAQTDGAGKAAEAQPDAQIAAPAAAANPNDVGWSTKFGISPPESSLFTGAHEQVAIVEKINEYFNGLTNLQGDFLQTDPDDKSKKGRFFIERPGKVRFDYARPSRQKIISDGKYLAIENHDLRTTDRYPLGSTPFKLLLTEQVDLVRDATIVSLDAGEDVVVIAVEDKSGEGSGQIRLFFDWPEVQLREWIITDVQGLNTRIELANLELNKEADPKLFKFSPDLGFPNFRSGGN